VKAKFVKVGNTRTRYLYEGSGSPLLLLHGIGHSADVFYRNIDELAKTHLVIAPDLPGHGFTDRIDLKGGAPQPPFVKHLEQLVDDLGFSSYNILGSSFGGLLACLMTLSRPSKVGSLIVVGSGGAFHSTEEQRLTLQKVLANATQAMSEPSLDGCRTRLASICYDPAAVAHEVLLTQLTSYGLGDRFEAFKEAIGGYLVSLDTDECRVHGRLEQIRCRTMIITGRQDSRASVESHEEAHRRISGSQLVVLDHCGHLPYMEHSGIFNQIVHDFLFDRAVSTGVQ
jgi:pimeloyl-ACP methyl ester carboxylesterase